ncbi:hypothetical protein JR316_0010126 [Psilocybe cubensis]|uniref:Uncharacterized protein n=2 Tax=Psilocybe cubensis TaxID=181762 RepID=A0A8H7XNY2_PSICU|nr:hypothetical protein JR316_0010126 [Psilocybe cubensis]KAH9477894.1 hypothetical protein JR316_0010126 [Psilocybe cubensis]
MVANKLRLYLAYFKRTNPSGANPERYHVSFMICPKKPKDNEPNARILHAVDFLDKNRKLRQIWRFEAKDSSPRTIMLSGVMLLGKLEPAITPEIIEEVLTKIYIPPTDADASGADWRCTNWVWASLEILAEERIIPRFDGTGQDLWNVGVNFVNGATNGNGIPVHDDWLYTCDMSGRQIDSEIGPYVRK